jgi:hypothetical protein
MSILCKTPSLRDVIAFPKTGAGTDLFFESPAPARSGVLPQYGIREVGCGDVLESAGDHGGAKFDAERSENTNPDGGKRVN